MNSSFENHTVPADQKQIKSLTKHTQVVSIAAIILFIISSGLKSALFNITIADPEHVYTFAAKAAMFFNALVLTSFVYLALFRRRTPVLFTIAYGLQLLYFLVNLIYFFYFESYLHLNQYFELWTETLELMKHSAVPFEPGILLTFIDLPFFLLVLLLYRQLPKFNRTAQFRYLVYVPSLILIWGFSQWTVLAKRTPFELMNDQYLSESTVVRQYGLLTFNLISLLKINDNRKLIHQLNQGDPMHVAADSSRGKPNFLVVQVESMDAFIVNRFYKGKPVTPWLYNLGKKCCYFPYMLSYHKAGSTSDCEFSVINSVEALDEFPSIKIRNYDFPNSMIKRFVADTYAVAMFHGNRGEYFNRKIAFRKMGFPAFYDMMAMGLKDVVWGAPDSSVIAFMESKLPPTDKPFFYYVITMSSHEPFTFTQSYYKPARFNSIKDDRIRNYFTCLAYVDHTLQKLVTRIRKQYPDTYVLIFGDHTPGIKRGIYHQSSMRLDDMTFEFVPLFIITPDNQKVKNVDYAVSFLDVAPTMLRASGMPFALNSYGQDLLDSATTEHRIHYKGNLYDGRYLYKKIKSQKRTGSNP